MSEPPQTIIQLGKRGSAASRPSHCYDDPHPGRFSVAAGLVIIGKKLFMKGYVKI